MRANCEEASRPWVRRTRSLLAAEALAVVLVASTGLLSPNGRAQSQQASGESRVLNVVPASDPSFDTSLDANFPKMKTEAGYEDMRPLLAIIQNKSPHPVLAYVIRWSVSYSDGSQDIAELDQMSEPDHLGQILLSGRVPVLKAGEIRFVSSSFSLDIPNYRQLTSSRGSNYLLGYLNFDKVASKIHSAQTIEVSVDGVVYDDGVFEGPDKSKLFERFQTEQQGQHEEAQSVLRQLNAGVTGDALVAVLDEDIFKGQASTGTDNQSLDIAARGREAQRILAYWQDERPDVFRWLLTRLANAAPAVLTNATPQ
jgi:hypothetical protein